MYKQQEREERNAVLVVLQCWIMFIDLYGGSMFYFQAEMNVFCTPEL